MRRLQSGPLAGLCMLMTILFVLVRCTSEQRISSIEIQETDDRSLQGIGETIRINNCGGETNIEQNIQQLHEISLSGLSPELNSQLVREAVAAHYAKDYGTSRDISLIIPPNTQKEIVVAWMYETRSGVLTIKGKSERPTYTIKIAFGVGPVASTDLGC